MKVIRVLAPNPGPYTGPGTNTYLIVSDGQCLVVDPGPLDERHLESLRRSMEALRPVAVAVTHSHSDHAAAANQLAAELGVPAGGFGPGPGFRPEVLLDEGEKLVFGRYQAEVLHTPGHSPDHLCYLVEDVLFTGDHIIGGSTTVVEDMTAYLASLERLLHLPLRRLYPGHGPEVEKPSEVILQYLEHRREREHQVLEALGAGAATIEQVVDRVYHGVDPALRPLAARSALAHLRKLVGREWCGRKRDRRRADGVCQHQRADTMVDPLAEPPGGGDLRNAPRLRSDGTFETQYR